MNPHARWADGPICQPNDQRWAPQEADAARTALGAFLAGFGLDASRHGRLVERLLAGASAADTVLEHAEQQVEAWLGLVLGPEILTGQPALPVGRAAFLGCDGPTVWAGLFLVDDGLPEAFTAAMRTASPSPTPMPMPGAMAAQPLDSWSIADAREAVINAFDGPLGWAANARPLITASIRLTKPAP